MIDYIGGRKFIAFLIVLILLFVLVIMGKIDAGTFSTFITLNLGVYTAGNVIEKKQ